MNEIELERILREKAEFYRTSESDPHDTNTAVYIALKDAAEAIKEAREAK